MRRAGGARGRVLAALGWWAALAGCDDGLTPQDEAPVIDAASIDPGAGDAVTRLTIAGRLSAAPAAGTLVYLYEHRRARGFFVMADDDGAFVFEDVSLDMQDNCLQLYAQEPGAPRGSLNAFYVFAWADGDSPVWTSEETGACVDVGS